MDSKRPWIQGTAETDQKRREYPFLFILLFRQVIGDFLEEKVRPPSAAPPEATRD
jgi:hypothetical protein